MPSTCSSMYIVRSKRRFVEIFHQIYLPLHIQYLSFVGIHRNLNGKHRSCLLSILLSWKYYNLKRLTITYKVSQKKNTILYGLAWQTERTSTTSHPSLSHSLSLTSDTVRTWKLSSTFDHIHDDNYIYAKYTHQLESGMKNIWLLQLYTALHMG